MPKAKHYGRGAPARGALRITKGLVTGEFEGGAHWHRLDRANMMTEVDGEHRHLYLLPDGTLVATEKDGGHRHDIDSELGHEWVHGGTHTHFVILPDGQRIQTGVGGEHGHSTQVESTTLDGIHTHPLVLPDGRTIESLSVAEFVQRGGAPPADASVMQQRGDVYMRFGKRAQLDVSIGRTRLLVDVGRRDLGDISADEAEEMLKSFSVDGSPHFHALARGVPCREVSDLDRPHHGQLDGEGRLCLVVSKATFEAGTGLEWFAAGGELRGRVAVEDDHLVVQRNGFPSVLKGGLLPSFGIGIPSAMARQVPQELRWWEATKAEERDFRHQTLCALRWFSPETTRLTNAGLTKVHVEHKEYVYEPDPVLDEAAVVKAMLPDGPVESPMSESLWRDAVRKSDALQFFHVGDDPDQLEMIVAELQKTAVPYFLLADDTADARRLLAPLGAIYKHRAGAWGSVVSTNVPVDADVIDVSKTLDLPAPTDACVSSHTEESEDGEPDEADLHSEFEKNTDELISKASTWIVAKQEDEERFILGIVAEPDEIDTQQDTIQAPTIREAAHKFMEDFRNIGLQHQTFVNGRVKILESYITRVDQEINGQLVKKGSWVLGVRVMDDRIWKAVKDGSFTGFSLGGTAIREPLA